MKICLDLVLMSQATVRFQEIMLKFILSIIINIPLIILRSRHLIPKIPTIDSLEHKVSI
jgi:hypothetical protein